MVMVVQGRLQSGVDEVVDFMSKRHHKVLQQRFNCGSDANEIIVDSVCPEEIAEYCKILIEQHTSSLFRRDYSSKGLVFFNDLLEVVISPYNGMNTNEQVWSDSEPATELLVEVIPLREMPTIKHQMAYLQDFIGAVCWKVEATQHIKVYGSVGFWGGASLAQLQVCLWRLLTAATFLNARG